MVQLDEDVVKDKIENESEYNLDDLEEMVLSEKILEEQKSKNRNNIFQSFQVRL
jgi:hypothetical protein